MKTKRISSLVLWLFMFLGVFSCVKDDDFSSPEKGMNPPEIDGDTISIYDVKAALAQEANRSFNFKGDEQYTFKDTDHYMKGYVTSSDEGGNFYQEMVLQDKPENPTSGIKLMIAKDPLYTQYEIGRKVYVKLEGFTVGFSNGVLALGVPKSGNDYVEKAPKSFEDKIIRSSEKKEIVPLPLEISDFDEGEYDNLFIELDSLQFPDEMVLGAKAQTFSGEPEDGYDALRIMESCKKGKTTYLSTSTFADYKFLELPKKQGSLVGILSKDFEGEQYVIKLNTPAAVHFDQERCAVDSSGNGEPESPVDPDNPDKNSPEPPDKAHSELAFPGADFEDWTAFREGLTNSGIQPYASKSPGNGRDGSTALKIYTSSKTTSGNDYVFIAKAWEKLPSTPIRLTFYLKGTAEKSLSFNLYTPDEKTYHSFNLKDVSSSAVIDFSGSNRYTGTIDTKGEWVLISLDLSPLKELNTTDLQGKFLALKIGKEANYDLFLDDFRVE